MSNEEKISFSKTQKCLDEINEILNNIKKITNNLPLSKHEELHRILFSHLIIQYTQEFNDNAEIIWNSIIKKYPNIQNYDDSKRTLFNQYIGYTDLVILIYGIEVFNEISEMEDYQVCKKYWKSRHLKAHPTSNNLQKLIDKENNAIQNVTLEGFDNEKVLEKSILLLQKIQNLSSQPPQ